MKNIKQTIRSTGICLMTAAIIALPTAANAGWFSSKPVVKKVVTKAKATPGNITAKVTDISKKINEMAAQMEKSRPLMTKVKNSNMMNTLKEVIDFVGEQQADYQMFVSGDIYTFRQNFQDMLIGFGGVINDFPALEDADRLNDKLFKAGDMINKMPTQFLYIMDKAVGEKLITINEKISDIRYDLAKLPQLPSPRIVMQDPRAYEAELCKLVDSRETAITIAVIQAKLKSAIWTLNTIRGYLPDDLTMSATAVAGGGFTASIHPAQIPLKTPLVILEAIDLVIGNNVSIAQAMCKGVLPN